MAVTVVAPTAVTSSMTATDEKVFPLLELPADLFLYTATFLPPNSLSALSLTRRVSYTLLQRPLFHAACTSRLSLERTALHWAATHGATRFARALLASPTTRTASPKDVWGMTPLHAAANHRQAELVSLLLAAGADATATWGPAVTALHWAAGNADLRSLRLLIRAGADVGAADNYAETPLHWVARAGALDDNEGVECVQVQLRALGGAAKVIVVEKTVEDRAEGEQEVVKRKQKEGGDRAVVARVLLDAPGGADMIEARNWNGETPLHVAAAAGDVDVVRCLLVMGASARAVDSWGRSPASRAVEKHHVEVAEMLGAGIFRG